MEHIVFLTAREGNCKEARLLLRKALPPARKMGGSALGKVMTLWGYLVFKEGAPNQRFGDSIEEKRRGLELITLGLENMDPFYQKYSLDLYLAQLETELPPEVVLAAKERGKTLNPEAVLQEIAAEVR